ncbi:MAG: type II restriction endonuclease [Porphyromonas endodontalis]|jgi:type-2 restriction enzyme mboI|uniref:type II restriction endonuclease n=1 Tax=Porphyromonas endodontalis TaxID=28124 RepID=UPI0036067D4F
MDVHTQEEFDAFMSNLSDTNATLEHWTDFQKVKNNVSVIRIKLNTLNCLLGTNNLNDDVKTLWREYSSVFEVLPILIACRDRDQKKVINNDSQVVTLDSYLTSEEGVIEFLEGTGLDQLFKDKDITNLVDYVFGVEVGLDSNARKNRSGHAMEATVERMIRECGLRYEREVESSKWEAIYKALGADIKRFDFVIYTQEKTYLIEVNFYSSGGSKLNEVARSYTDLCPRVNAVPGFEFVWITDGKGWEKAKNKLQEAFFSIPSIYNLSTLRGFLCHINNGI